MVRPHEACPTSPVRSSLSVTPYAFQSPHSVLKSIVFTYYVYIYLFIILILIYYIFGLG